MKFDDAKWELTRLRNDPDYMNRDGVKRKIEGLKWPHREILLLRYYKSLSWKQISEAMGYSTDHLRGYMNRKAIECYADGDES